MKLCSPYTADAPLGRVDAGVDYARPYYGPIFAIADCAVTDIVKVGTVAWGGLGRVKFKLDHPITVNGRTYQTWYSAEAGHYPVKAGQHFKAGDQVAFTQSGWQESGFVGSQSFNEQAPTREGQDFLAFVKQQRGLAKPPWHPANWWAHRPGFRPF